MDIFLLMRNFFNWSFENPEKVKPNHVALYFFCIEHCNRLGWKEKFGLPTTMAKEAIGIHSYNTYINTLKDLVDFGFIKIIEKSKNQFSSNIIAISKNNKATNKALDKALIKHDIKQRESNSSIDIQETILQETRNHFLLFEKFKKKYGGTKKGSETEFINFQRHKDWKLVLPTLETAVDNQILERKQKTERKEFVPEWKNLQTWINQRCWEQEVILKDEKPIEVSTRPNYRKIFDTE